jgi:hypothetical protein
LRKVIVIFLSVMFREHLRDSVPFWDSTLKKCKDRTVIRRINIISGSSKPLHSLWPTDLDKIIQ